MKSYFRTHLSLLIIKQLLMNSLNNLRERKVISILKQFKIKIFQNKNKLDYRIMQIKVNYFMVNILVCLSILMLLEIIIIKPVTHLEDNINLH